MSIFEVAMQILACLGLPAQKEDDFARALSKACVSTAVTVFFAFLLMSSVARAEDNEPPPPDIYDIVRVTEVYNLQHKGSEERDGDGVLDKRKAGLNEIIVVKVRNLGALLSRAKCQWPYDQKPCTEQEIALYLEGRSIKGLTPESGAPTLENTESAAEEQNKKADQEKADQTKEEDSAEKAETEQTEEEKMEEARKAEQEAKKAEQEKVAFVDGTLRYHLQRITTPEDQEDTQENWADLLGLGLEPESWGLRRPVEVSVGLADEHPVRTDVTSEKVKGKEDSRFYLVRIRKYMLLIWLAITLAGLYFLLRLSQKSDVLRDRAPVIWPQRKPYSLSAVQAVWWFFLVIVSFTFIWLVTGQSDLSPTALVLLGIGLGTGLGATVIDSNKRGKPDDKAPGDTTDLNLLLSDKQKLEAELDTLRSVGGEALEKKKLEYDQKIQEIRQKFPNAIGPAHEKFYLDILSDAGGVSFHRFQMLGWTIVLGIFFIQAVLSRLAMPQFSQTLLALMGISAGTYLGFKIPEDASVATQPAESPAAGDNGNNPQETPDTDNAPETPEQGNGEGK